MAKMADLGDVSEQKEGSMEAYKELATPDIHNVGQKIKQASDAYKNFAGIEDRPIRSEIVVWYIYGLCSYFIHTVLLPIVFPLIISQMVPSPQPPDWGWTHNSRGLHCKEQEMKLYEALVQRSITVKNSKLSPLNWAAISWAAGIFLSFPILAGLAFHIDHGQNQTLIAAAATAIGALFCLPAGFFNSVWIFAPYTAAIVAASTVAAATHTRHLGLMLRGFTGPTIKKQHFPTRRNNASWLSLHATAAGTMGAAIIAAFTYHMLRPSEKVDSLWIVSIFSGLKWMVGICHAFAGNRPGPTPDGPMTSATRWAHAFAIFGYPHAVGSAAGVLFLSFSTACISMGGLLYVVGELCIQPIFLLCLWLTYFLSPLISLPLLHPLQLLIRADALRMLLFGFLISAVTSGAGFYFRHDKWHGPHMISAAVLQGTAAGVMHAFGQVLVLDCSPPGMEGSFSAWFVWAKAVGTCAGFAVASTIPGDVGRAFGVAFLSVIVGVVLMIFGNVSDLGGAVAAGHVRGEVEESEKGSPAHGRDNSTGDWNESVHTVVREEGRQEQEQEQEKEQEQV